MASPRGGHNSTFSKRNSSKTKQKSLKQRIRSVQRLLSKPELPATVRVSQERMLDYYTKKLEEQKIDKKDLKMMKKYKMVKFFEKRKLWRQHRAVTKELKEDDVDVERLKELQDLQKKIYQDLNYIEYFPSDKKYISLFPVKSYCNELVISEQASLHHYINEKVNAGELPQASFSDKKICKARNVILNESCKKTREHEKKKNFAIDDDFFIDTCGDQ